jgi:hypothetical protein
MERYGSLILPPPISIKEGRSLWLVCLSAGSLLVVRDATTKAKAALLVNDSLKNRLKCFAKSSKKALSLKSNRERTHSVLSLLF